MLFTAPKKQKGFTLLEIMVVMTIIVVLSALVMNGIDYLRDTTALDISVRAIQGEIQSTQNNAINSFIAYQKDTATLNNLNQRRISIGWKINLVNDINSNSVNITKQSLFFSPPDTMSPDQLRNDIQDFYKHLNNTFDCSTLEKIESVDVTCSTEDLTNASNDDYESISIPGVLLDTTSTGSTPNCTSPDGVDIYFTSGYGEIFVKNVPQKSDCQIVLEKQTGLAVNHRAVRITYETGAATSCSSSC